MTRDLGARSYFRITVRDLEHLDRTDFVTLTLPEGGLTIPVGLLIDRFATSKSWLNKGDHASSTFPQWLAPYRQGRTEPRADGVDVVGVNGAASSAEAALQAVARKSGVNDAQRKEIRKALDAFVVNLSEELGISPEALVLEMRYYHQSATNPYRTNASKADRRKSLEHYGHRCQAPGCTAVLSMDSAVFHHRRRGFSGQHEPSNLLPFCESCHDREHRLPAGKSLSKGSRK